MTDNWIKDAFDKAADDVRDAEEIAEEIRSMLDGVIPVAFDIWCSVIGRKEAEDISDIINSNENLSDGIAELCKVFFTAGYMINNNKNNH